MKLSGYGLSAYYEPMAWLLIEYLKWVNDEKIRNMITLKHFSLCRMNGRAEHMGNLHINSSNIQQFDYRKCDGTRKVNMCDQFCQLLTSITKNTRLKSFYFSPIKLSKQASDFLRFWYNDPYGYCDIPRIIINENELKTKQGKRRRLKLLTKLKYYVLVSQYDNDDG